MNKVIKIKTKPKQKVETVVVQPVTVTQAPSAKALRRRRQRARKRAVLQQLGPVPRLVRQNGTYEDELQDSVRRVKDSLFFPSSGGIHRGIGSGFTQTALAYVKGFQEIQLGPTNSFWGMVVTPRYVNSTNWMYNVIAPGVTDPNAYTGGSGAGALITSTQATDYRVVSCSISIIPTGAYTNQSGDGCVGYIPDTLMWNYSLNAITNLHMEKPFNAVTPLELHWVPSLNSLGNETNLLPITQSIIAGSSAFQLGFLTTSTTGSVTFRVEYRVGIEYCPSTAQRPYVSRVSPVNHPDTFHYINKIVNAEWDPLVVAYAADYRALLEQHDAMSGGLKSIETLGGLGASYNGPRQMGTNDDDELIQEEESMTIMSKAKRAACKTASDLGFEICDNPKQALQQLYSQVTRSQTGGFANPMGIGQGRRLQLEL